MVSSNDSKLKQKAYRERLKNDPEKYEEMLRKARERSKRNRAAKKARWEGEPKTRRLQQEIESFQEKERKRCREYYQRKKEKTALVTRQTANSRLAATTDLPDKKKKRPKDMNPDERREHNRKLRQASRQNETSMKSFWRKKKDRERKQRGRGEKRSKKTSKTDTMDLNLTPPCTSETIGENNSVNTPVYSPVKKSENNMVCEIRRKLKKKTPAKFARIVLNLAKPTEECKTALRKEILSAHERLQLTIATAKRKFKVVHRKTRKDALSKQEKKVITKRSETQSRFDSRIDKLLDLIPLIHSLSSRLENIEKGLMGEKLEEKLEEVVDRKLAEIMEEQRRG